MTNVQSKLWQQIPVNCQPHFHPWTKSCAISTIGLFMHAFPFCLRLYAMFYGASMLSRLVQRNKLNEFKRIIYGWLQSTAFLTTNAFAFQFYNCLVRQILGYFNRFTTIYVPAFLASLTAILIERPTRRPLLTLYVANVATETLWRMLEARGLVRSIPHGECYIFAAGISVLLYYYRINEHKRAEQNDAIYKVIQFLMGKEEAKPLTQTEHLLEKQQPDTQINSHKREQPMILYYYEKILDFLKHKNHASCPHGSKSCTHYCVHGGLRTFGIGVGLQMGLKLFTAATSKRWRNNFYLESLQLGGLLGGFTFIYRAVSCALRHIYGHDDERFAIPAALLASYSFRHYPSNTVALYVFWKMLHQVYNKGVEKKLCPKVPGFGLLLYASCTALLFHSAILEPKTMRSSYFRFLCGISGERLCKFNLEPFDALGYDTTKNMQEVAKNLKIVLNSPIPKCGWA